MEHLHPLTVGGFRQCRVRWRKSQAPADSLVRQLSRQRAQVLATREKVDLIIFCGMM